MWLLFKPHLGSELDFDIQQHHHSSKGEQHSAPITTMDLR